MNVDLIKFVNDDNYIKIYTKDNWWQYLHNISQNNMKEIYLVECRGERIVTPGPDLNDIIEELLNIPHQSQVVDMIRYMKGKTI